MLPHELEQQLLLHLGRAGVRVDEGALGDARFAGADVLEAVGAFAAWAAVPVDADHASPGPGLLDRVDGGDLLCCEVAIDDPAFPVIDGSGGIVVYLTRQVQQIHSDDSPVDLSALSVVLQYGAPEQAVIGELTIWGCGGAPWETAEVSRWNHAHPDAEATDPGLDALGAEGWWAAVSATPTVGTLLRTAATSGLVTYGPVG